MFYYITETCLFQQREIYLLHQTMRRWRDIRTAKKKIRECRLRRRYAPRTWPRGVCEPMRAGDVWCNGMLSDSGELLGETECIGARCFDVGVRVTKTKSTDDVGAK